MNNNEFPRWAYHFTETALIVDNEADFLALGEGWDIAPVTTEPVIEPKKPVKSNRKH